MAVSFGTQIITRAQLRAEIGDPTSDVRSPSYVSDTQLDTLIARFDAIAKGLIDEKVKNLTDQEIELFAPQSVPVNITLTSGDAQYPLVAQGSLNSTYFPYVFRAVHATGIELSRDDSINWTASVLGPLYTLDPTDPQYLYRYRTIGAKILVLPSGSNNVKAFMVPLSVVEAKLAPAVISEINNQILDAARRMVQDRMAMAVSFKQDSQSEAP